MADNLRQNFNMLAYIYIFHLEDFIHSELQLSGFRALQRGREATSRLGSCEPTPGTHNEDPSHRTPPEQRRTGQRYQGPRCKLLLLEDAPCGGDF
ncbi:hypothetical protein RB195_017397 [Necator americanus]|uniref:Uncharacterized protein n=1 Tax=Necator americanus TaxID=51031 RepID=A0ABR1C6Z5_NECAM